MSQINLLKRSLSLNESSPYRSKVYLYTSIVLISYLVLVALAFGWTYWLNRSVDQTTAQVETLKAELASLDTVEKKYILLKTRTTLLNNFIQSREGLKTTLEKLVDSSQGTVTISDLGVTTALPSFDINMKILNTDPVAIEQYLAQIPDTLTKTVNSYTRLAAQGWQSELTLKYASQSASKTSKL